MIYLHSFEARRAKCRKFVQLINVIHPKLGYQSDYEKS